MKYIKEYWLLILAFLTSCAALYHVAYWWTFGINGLSFLDASDLIKSFIYPMISVFGVSVYYFLLGYFSRTNTSSESQNQSEKSKFGIKQIALCLLGVTAISVYVYEVIHDEPAQYLLAAVLTGEFLIFFIRQEKLLPQLPNIEHKGLFIRAVIYLPVLSYSAANFNASTIKNNYKFDYVVVGNTKDTLKYLGKGGDYLIFTDLKNTRNIIISTRKIDTLYFEKGGRRYLP